MNEPLFDAPFVMPIRLSMFQIMFTDGRIIRVIADKDTSDMRAFALRCIGIDSSKNERPDKCIAGVANLGEHHG